MKTSEVINKLQELQTRYGDLPVCIETFKDTLNIDYILYCITDGIKYVGIVNNNIANTEGKEMRYVLIDESKEKN